ncbi:response regulator [Candidatus Wolfebacteria bacterium]|nr:response regulator [Candidatus Wolfebacteria bacterium]
MEKPLVLIIDDEADIRDALSLKLKASGFNVHEANNGEEGVRLANALKPDIIILDVVMPIMDGVTAFFKMKENDNLANVKFFFFTGKGDSRERIIEINRKFAKGSGAIDFIRKETDLDELVGKLKMFSN